ncbi:MAG TPA: response regulator transcription factor [Nitrospiria bacterium]|jgi:two-component system response regulator NreC
MMGNRLLSLVIIAKEERIPKQIEGSVSGPFQISISFKTSDIEKGLKKLKDLNPKLVLIDLQQVEEEKVAFLLKIHLSHPDSQLLIIPAEFAVNEWLQFLKAGVRAIFEKDFSGKDLALAASVVIQGGIYLGPGRMVQFIEQCANKVKHADEKARDLLTDREIQVLKVLAEGYTVKKAAGILGLSPKTVDTHKANLMRKINIHHRADLIKYALRKKIISLQED